jgi:hypothetical protein
VNAHEGIVAASKPGIYESNYLKANSPDGRRAFWIKHNLLRPLTGPGFAEIWAIAFELDRPPRVYKREVPWDSLALDPDRIGFRAGAVSLTADRAEGALADATWSLGLAGGLPPLLHLRHPWMYTAAFPKKKLMTPAPNLRFRGELRWGADRWQVTDWIGLRGHNWGTEHAWTYAYGNCNAWDDGADRAFDGFSAKIRLGGRPTPWLSGLVGWGPEVRRNRLRHLLAPSAVTLDRWTLQSGPINVEMTADPATYAGLRYQHPDGRESYCYNTKFAAVSYTVEGRRSTSRQGELEVLFPTAEPSIALHPAPGWRQEDGDYAG